MREITCVVVICLLLPFAATWDHTSGILNVHVVPHSHNDPGWWKTFEGYYQDWTKGILSSVVEILAEERTRTFIWAEISYFQRWWEDQSESVKDTVKKLVKNGQLEFVTAGWVMNDEANTHVVDIINQLTEGHEWLYKTLKTKPKIGWAIDPFGHSPTMPYVLQQMGFEGMVINRAHRQLKQDFRDRRHLEFMWTSDNLNSSTSFNMMTHMLPWKLYDIPNTCGPDWHVCASFDFERDGVAIPITHDNVKERSEQLVKMYKEKAKLFRHNSVLIPLGDDFKYKNPTITRLMMTQYEMLFKYINSDKSLGVNIKFSTLGQYFADLPQNPTATSAATNEPLFPSYQGDFFTYCDEGEEYWSGYFTTRPFMKGLTRSTQAILRTGEILATLAHVHVGENVRNEEWSTWFDSIETARRNVALFQHHDGVTGTARRVVVDDYAERLLTSLAKVAELSSDMALVVLSKSADPGKAQPSTEGLRWTTEPAKRIGQAIPRVLSVQKDSAVVVIFNPLAHSRTEVVSVIVNNHEVRVIDSEGADVAAQVDPVWEGGSSSSLSSTQFTLHFVVKVAGLGLTTYFIVPAQTQHALLSSVVEYSASSSPDSSGQIAEGWHLDRKPLASSSTLRVANSQYKIELTSFGTIKNIVRHTGKGNLNTSGSGSGSNDLSVSVEQNFLSYSTFSSGAYLFLPRGAAAPLPSTTLAVRVITGPLVSTVHSVTDSSVKEHILRLYECNPTLEGHKVLPTTTPPPILPCPQALAIELVHQVDLTDGNTEIVTRFNSNIPTKGRFYTDSNGLDMRERVYDKALPIQGNYYPMTASAYIESDSPSPLKNSGREAASDATSSASSARLTVLSHQAHGVTSLKDGELEIMLDRRLNQDDNRGLGEPIMDNVRTSIPLWLVVESTPLHDPYLHPSISAAASEVWHTRNYPLHTMHAPIQPQTATATATTAAAAAAAAATTTMIDTSASTTTTTTPLHKQWGSNHHLTVDPLSSPFPDHLQILTLAPRAKDSDDVIMRVYHPPVTTSNTYPAAGGGEYKLVMLFKHLSVVNIKETSLSILYEKQGIAKEIVRPTEIKTMIINLIPATNGNNNNNDNDNDVNNNNININNNNDNSLANNASINEKNGTLLDTDLHNLLLADKKNLTPTTAPATEPAPTTATATATAIETETETATSANSVNDKTPVDTGNEKIIDKVDKLGGSDDNNNNKVDDNKKADTAVDRVNEIANEKIEVDNKKTEVEEEQDTLDGLFTDKDKEKEKGPLDDETELIVPPEKNLGQAKEKKEVKGKKGDKIKSSGEGRVGKTGAGVDATHQKQKKNPAGTTSNPTGLYAMSVVFYLGLLVLVMLGGWLVGRRRSNTTSSDEKRSSTSVSRMPSVWKEREDSMMKLL